jgi:hypothetical protein
MGILCTALCQSLCVNPFSCWCPAALSPRAGLPGRTHPWTCKIPHPPSPRSGGHSGLGPASRFRRRLLQRWHFWASRVASAAGRHRVWELAAASSADQRWCPARGKDMQGRARQTARDPQHECAAHPRRPRGPRVALIAGHSHRSRSSRRNHHAAGNLAGQHTVVSLRLRGARRADASLCSGA